MGIETRFAAGTVVASDGFEYSDLTALTAAGWTLTDTMGAVSTPSIETSTVHGGTAALRIDVSGTPGADQNCYYSRTFTGLTPYALYAVQAYIWENEEAGGSDGIACGLEVANGGSAYIELGDSTSAWVAKSVQGLASADGELTVRVGFFGSLAALYDRIGRFDDLTVTLVGDLGVLVGAGVLMVDGAVLGLSRDGWAFDPQITYDTWEYDGQLDPMAGTDVRRTAKPVLQGTLVELGASQLAALEPLGAFATTATNGTTSTVVTPAAGATALTSGDLLTNVVAIWPRLTGGFHHVTLALGLCTKYSLAGKDKSEVGVPIEIQGRTSTAGIAAYTHTVIWA